MNLDRVIAVRTNETVYRDGMQCVKVFGDGFTNLVTPALGATAGSLAIAGVPLSKWLKWALPITLLMLVVSWIILYFLGSVGWTGV